MPVPRYQRIPAALGSNLGDETVVLNFDNGVYYSVQGVGGLLWRLLESPVTEDDLVAAVTKEFEVAEERCRTDIRAFLKQMQDEGLVTAS